jgi:hypothetical protein
MAVTANTGSNNWNTNAAWVGGVQPTAADDVIIPASAIVTIPTATTALGRSCTVQASGTVVFATATSVLTLGDGTAGAGNVALSVSATATITLTGVGTINFISTSATQQTIDSGGKTLPNITFSGVGSSYKLLTNGLTLGATTTLTLNNGTFDTNGLTCSWGIFSSNVATARTLTLGNSAITISGTTGTVFNFSNTTNLTFNSNTSTISFTSSATITIQLGAGQTYNNVVLPGTAVTIGGATVTFNNLTCAPAAGASAFFVIGGNWTINGTLTLTCTDSGATGGRGWLTNAANPSPVNARTITAAAVSLSNFDFSDIIAAGGVIPWSGTNLGDGQGNSNITFPSSRTLYWVGTPGSWTALNRWSLSSGGVTGGNHIPMAHDDAMIDANSALGAGGTLSVNRVMGRNIDMSNASNTFTWNNGLSPAALFGNLMLKAGSTVSGAGQFGFNGRGTQTLKTNGVAFATSANPSFRVTAFGGSYTLQDDLTVTAATGFQVDGGTFDAAGFNVTTPIFNSSATGIRSVIMGTGTWTLNGTGAVFNCATITGLTFSGASATVLVTDTSASTKTIEHRQTVNKIGTLTVTGSGSGAVLFGPSGYYGVLNLGAPKTYSLSISGTGLKVDTLNAVGTAGNIITIISQSPGTQTSITKSSGVVSADYLSLTDSNATGGASWYAGANSTSVSNNTGWIFTTPPSGTPNMLLMGIG